MNEELKKALRKRTITIELPIWGTGAILMLTSLVFHNLFILSIGCILSAFARKLTILIDKKYNKNKEELYKTK
ncbi:MULTISPECIES: hypothetical protein [Lactobacillales]|uniref:hypothetical protein n=1 Tax=Lactobacillales TaxID=186826 RepID=UPI000CF2BA33|nr:MULTISPECIES: hypothetical protein [Lactobacillales]NLS48337.1 hypothetical protein [Lactococcus lactis]NSP54856.1 hypothetical protein [Enterococcus faecalis]NSQ56247.1 hypothetical protein [Enterococcus faecalis]NSW34279.1 hypothetical protein [Enterococcus faecalis]PQF54150.1 hypothetical protein CUS76_11150 [Enterococcus faecalis]